jgi:ATP-dependent RNA/DNA helicase IGHMBP2
MDNHPYQKVLIESIALELKEQEKRYFVDNNSSLKQLKSQGLAIHPITILRKSFGFADYPELSFKIPYISDTSNFKDNCAIECFIEGEEPIKGVLLNIDERKGDFRIFAPDFPNWIEEYGVGIKLTPDQHTFEAMKKAMLDLNSNLELNTLFHQIHGNVPFGDSNSNLINSLNGEITFLNPNLNESQQSAVNSILYNKDLTIVHGPPGTGKTTTLIESITQLIQKGEKILVTAPSNTAVDHIAKGLLKNKIKILRVGNTSKVDEEILANTPDGKMLESKESKEIKKLKIRAEEYRKMATQYKRNFGFEERNQRNLLLKEVKKIRLEIKKIRTYFFDLQFEQAQVILGTPIGLNDSISNETIFDTLIIDEAGQCLEPLAWLLFPKCKKWILSGDQFQLPPTVLSQQAIKLGFNVSILERAIKNCQTVSFLDTQYRMRKSIASFSSSYFYQNKLQTPAYLSNVSEHILFYDTAGTGFSEEIGNDGFSLINQGEIEIVNKLILHLEIDVHKATFISPYSAQTELAKKQLPKGLKIKTIDSFQGQESELLFISLVRSNSESTIGFLNDYRRMNVALTRAKEKLIVIGDSSTLGQDKFYESFINYIEKINGYRSAWEILSVD